MEIAIYQIIFILFGVLLFWTWNNAKEFETNVKRIKFIAIGLIILSVVTLIIFKFSKIGIKYPSEQMAGQVQKMAMLIFVPINGFLSLPHIASIKSDIMLKSAEEEKIKRKIIILGVVILVAIIFEIIYLKDFQNGIIGILNSKK